MDQGTRPPARTRVAAVVVAAALAAGVLVLVREEPGRDLLVRALAWVDGFVHSPGLGGAAALGAAMVALGQWRRQERERREAAAAAHRLERDAHWWEMYRLLRTAGSSSTYSDRALVRALVVMAETEIQSVAAGALAATLTDEDQPDHERGRRDADPPGPRAARDPHRDDHPTSAADS